ncbi:MAG: hypothetical protein JNM57_01495 [Cyclobacteriaceae bacterium]|nr:hypothetical protein [Cyclobacteriaceae bacterium]
MIQHVQHMYKRNSRQAGLIMILLGVFVLGKTPFAYVHTSLHAHDEAELHTPLTEEDPCHQAIYHNQQSGCHHAAHITSALSCPWCAITFNIDPYLNLSLTRDDFRANLNSEKSNSIIVISLYSNPRSSRAPPKI